MKRLLAGTVLVVLACGSDDAFAPELNVVLENMTQTASGLYFQDLVVGSGEEAAPGTTVTVHYTGWLTDGTQFDTSRNGVPLTFALGIRRVIQGWEEGVPGMRVGGMRKLVIPPQLAYGDQGAGNSIPPGATLVFDVELLAVVVEP